MISYKATHQIIYIYISLSLSLSLSLLKTRCKDQVWVPSPDDGWTLAQKAQNNEFVESGLENWVKMSWITNKVGSVDKNRENDWIKLEKIVLGIVRGDQFLYIPYKFDYKVGSWLLQCFSCDFSIPYPWRISYVI